MKNFKKLPSLIITFAMILSVIPFGTLYASADSDNSCGDNAFWSLDASGLLEITGTGDIADFTASGAPWYGERNSVKALSIADGITSVGNNAFYDCSNLAEVTLPDGVSEIGNNAFRDCDKLEAIDLPAELKIIGSRAFYYSGLKKVVIPASVTSIGADAFGWCSRLTSIEVDSLNANYSADENGVLFNKDKTELIKYPCGKENSDYDIPETVQIVAEYAFENCADLKTVYIPDSVTSLDGAFFNCGFEYVAVSENNADYSNDADGALLNKNQTQLIFYPAGNTAEEYIIPSTVTQIDADAFYNADNLKGVAVTDGVKTIADGTFFMCAALEYVHIPASVEAIGEYAVADGAYICSETENCYAKTYAEANGIEFIVCDEHTAEREILAYGNCESNVRWILYADGELVILGKGAMPDFEEGKAPWADYLDEIKKATVTDGITNISINALNGCENLTEVSAAKSVTSYGDAAFKNCASLAEIEISENVTAIGSEAFAGTALEYVHIPSTVTEIGANLLGSGAAYICSDSEDCYAKEYAQANGYEFRYCGNQAVTGVELNETEIDIVKKNTYQLTANVLPENATDKTVSWKSDNSVVAKVDKNGLVTAVNAGETIITVSTADGGFTATCKVTVTPAEFSISWISDGVANVVYVEEGATVNAPVDPVKTGYTFVEWVPSIPEVMPAENLEFVAVWSVNSYNAVFDANGGVWADGSDNITLTVEYGKKITTPEAPAKQGYVFADWSPVVGTMDSVDGKSFTAMWTPASGINYTVNTYVMKLDGEYTKTTKTFTGTTDSTVNAEYTVENGFVLNSEKSVLSGVVAPDGSLVLEVYLDRVKVTVTIGGETKECLYGETIGEPDAPAEPEGHYHTGWVDENGNAVEFPITVGDGMPAKIIPTFAKRTYTVTWIVDGEETAQSYEYGQAIAKPADPEKEEYKFIGWGADIPDSMPAENLTFTAEFEKIYYTCECGKIFDNAADFNKHLAEEQAQKEYEQALKAVRVSIKNNPGTATIKYGETLKLTAVVKNPVDGIVISWYVDGEKVAQGETFNLSFENGSKTVEVKITNENGKVLQNEKGEDIADSQKVTVKSGFFQKLISFFKNLFRMNRVVVQSVLNVNF